MCAKVAQDPEPFPSAAESGYGAAGYAADGAGHPNAAADGPVSSESLLVPSSVLPEPHSPITYKKRPSIFENRDAALRNKQPLRVRAANLARDWSREIVRPQHLLLALFATAICVIAGVLLYVSMTNSNESQITTDFGDTSSDLVRYTESFFRRTLSEDLNSIRSAMCFAPSIQNVTYAQFTSLVTSNGGVAKGVQAVQWAPLVPQSLRSYYEAKARVEQNVSTFTFVDRGPGGTFVLAATRAEYYPVYFIQPIAGNTAVRGLDDLANDVTRRNAIYLARDSGLTICTKPFALAQTGKLGLVCYRAAYSTIEVPSDPLLRPNATLGAVTGVFQIGTIFDLILSDTSSARERLEIAAYDSEAGKLYSSQEGASAVVVGGSPSDVRAVAWGLRITRTIQVGDRTWTIVCTPRQSWLESEKSILPITVLCIFLGVLLMVLGFVLLRSYGDMKARKHAAEKQHLVDRLLPIPVGRVLVNTSAAFGGSSSSSSSYAANGATHSSDDDGIRAMQNVPPPLLLEIPFSCVVFLDLCGFTHFSEQHDAHEVVDLLYDLFTSLDELAERHGVCKVKTIGDNWMGATGLFPGQHSIERELAIDGATTPGSISPANGALFSRKGSQPNPQGGARSNRNNSVDLLSYHGNQSTTPHGSEKKLKITRQMSMKDVVDENLLVRDSPLWRRAVLRSALAFSLDAHDRALLIFQSRGFGDSLNIRVGIHCGPVIGAVIGLQRPVFDVWSPTVNIASRLESSSIPGRIHVSSLVYEEWMRCIHPAGGNNGVSPDESTFLFEKRPQAVTLKGVGAVDTYWLNSPVVSITGSQYV
eukprot:ANDGO_01287.mRNA.1 Adenylate cyclase